MLSVTLRSPAPCLPPVVQLHPDVSPGSHQEFVLLNEAYQTLSRRQTRALYDASLLRPPPAAAPPPGQAWKQYGDVESTHDRV